MTVRFEHLIDDDLLLLWHQATKEAEEDIEDDGVLVAAIERELISRGLADCTRN
ncbi:hypothetical protein QA640_45875 (plasmid) [Bradyrhizobium sp. CB82]|uniref:hypothetical protein n=1 Tax=Bradyrhizobium sp. CB82 TaxID=3039159 RepID=UPI0024B2133D|nr:hypothetical protein [Bradyrhizobium sp. CB82]WFU46089.1 hypothetical protein QA640_45875 [Bradyrhizobium sp. CB82]